MSASNENKQNHSAQPVNKAEQAKQEQAAYKRKVRIYTVVGVVVCVLIAALLIWNSGVFQSRATAATIGDEKLSVSEMSYYYYSNYSRQLYTYYGMLDPSLPDSEQIANEEDGTTYHDMFMEESLANAQTAMALYDAAIEAGYSKSDVADELDAQIDSLKASATSNGYSYKAYLKAVYGRYMTPAVYKRLTAQSLLANLYANDHSEEVKSAFTAEDLEAFYAENADALDEIEYSFLYFSGSNVKNTDADGNKLSDDEVAELTEKAMAEAKAKAEEALDSYRRGTEIDELIKEFEPSSSSDHASVQGIENLSSVYSEKLLSLGENEAAIVETENVGYYVVVFHSRGRNEDLTANVRHILIAAEATTDAKGDIVEPTDEAWAAAESEAKKALAEYEAGEKTADAFGALAEKYSDDTGSNTAGGFYGNVAEGNFVAEFNDWLFGENQPEAGDTAMFAHKGDAEAESSPYWGYHVAYLESWGEAEWALATSDKMLEDIMTEWTDGLTSNGYDAQAAAGAKHLGA